jgi:hypothetical protein
MVRHFKTTLNNLYHSCPDCGIQNKEKEKEFRLFSEKESDAFIERVYSGAIAINRLDRSYHKKLSGKLSKGVFEGFGKTIASVDFGTPDFKMLAALQENVYIFSAAKQYHEVLQMNSFLTVGDEVVPFSKFKKKALDVFKEYNVDHLKAEYNAAVGQSQMAAQWMDIEANVDTLPLLKYKTANDGRVRPTHQSLNNIVRPVGDKFWDTYYPKNGWNCRCRTISLHEGEETDLNDFKNPEDVPREFMFNPGKKKMVFSEAHPYFKVEDKDKNFAKKGFGLPMPDKNGQI